MHRYPEAARIILGIVIFVIFFLVFRTRAIPALLFELAISFFLSYGLFWMISRSKKG